MHSLLAAEENTAAQTAGTLTFFVVVAALSIWLIVSGNQQVRATQGDKGGTKRIIGWILVVLVVLGTVGRLAQA
ncbi:hypothetical protein [Aeromicrobium sp. NPDC092404]|uniref:hypothetical protein n=1 Tax=Aeromicrobium sp. NPDC092404 TaxID=3154976 RepID=UPI003428AB6B